MPDEQRDAFFVQKCYVGGGVVGQKGISTKIPAWEEPREATELKFKVYHAYYAFKKIPSVVYFVYLAPLHK